MWVLSRANRNKICPIMNDPSSWWIMTIVQLLLWFVRERQCPLWSKLLGQAMMTSSNGNIFRVTGHLCGKFTGPGEFPAQRPVTRSFGVFFDLRLSKQSWGWWFETLSCPLWRHRNAYVRPVAVRSPVQSHREWEPAVPSATVIGWVFCAVKHNSISHCCLS